MNDSKKEGMFAKLAQQQARAVPAEEDTPPSPAPADAAKPKQNPAKKKPGPPKGKRDNPDYCQANAYVPKKLRRAVDKALLDIDGLDYSSLIEDLLRKWVKTRGVSE
jgi:hypothetical protein